MKVRAYFDWAGLEPENIVFMVFPHSKKVENTKRYKVEFSIPDPKEDEVDQIITNVDVVEIKEEIK